ncbi:hypothetical protein Vau01_006800 [Virgisporangium aurantiacum]|uniref:DUF4259 domain-containing protein n=1 Tax=Virgisporangium aurantiacum TaxID=175570 RepID=A0A8J3YWG1_9ACTN|nr:hypothetical protein Vau01_006800 [Virgisporangium aurantiacum]
MTESGSVGAWDSGPFDNDEAADFAGQLDEADPNERIVLIREALQVGADSDDEEAFARAVAAAAVLAATRADIPVDWSYAPKFDVEGLDAPDDLVELAVLALDAVADSDSEYAELFGEAGTLETLRSALVM